MKLQEFENKVGDIRVELDRLAQVMTSPERVLGEFYDRRGPNILIQFFGMHGVTESELYDLLISQLRKLPVLSNCAIEKVDNELPASPLLISYKHPEFMLMRIDLRSKKYENVYTSILRGIDANIAEADNERKLAQERVDELTEIDGSVRSMADGDLKLNRSGAWAKKKNIKDYLKRMGYPSQDAKRITQSLEKFLDNCQTKIDVRNATLAEHQLAYAEQTDRRSQFDNNPYLQNTISDLVDLLSRCGYTESRVFTHS